MKEKSYYLDILHVISIFFVIMLHTTLTVFNYRFDKIWILCLVLQVLFIWPVPIFFMTSGAKLLEYRDRYSTLTFFKKRLSKILIPFLFWSIVTYIYKILTHQIKDFSIINFIERFIYNQIEPNYWFFYVIIGIYLCVPFISIIIKYGSRNLIAYIIILAIFTTAIGPIFFTLINRPYSSYFNIPMLGSYIGFYFLGWYLHTFEIKKIYRLLIYTLGILSILVMFFGTIYLSSKIETFDRTLYFYNSIFVYLYATSLFLFIKTKYYRKFETKKNKLIKQVSSITLGIYASHNLVIDILKRVFNLDSTSIFFILGLPFVVIIILIPSISFAKKIPILKHII